MGGIQVPGQGTGDDGFDEDGYDETQRAEILEATRDGPTDGTILTDLDPDLGDEQDEDDDIEMSDDDYGEEDDDLDMEEGDVEEDEVQADFDDDDVDEDDLDDADDEALNP